MQFPERSGRSLESFPKAPDFAELEKHWGAEWLKKGTYTYPSQGDAPIFSIDTPPPTVSGSLHVGHIFSYTQTDILARFARMKGMRVHYPQGWDDNGLPTERRVQNYFHIRCEPGTPYEPGLNLPPISEVMTDKELAEKKVPQRALSRRNFVEHCLRLTTQDEKQFKDLFTRVGLSADWELEYVTIGKHAQRIAQWSFLDLMQKGHAYQVEAPTLWDCDFRTAVAQAELEDRDMPGAFHEFDFEVEGGGSFTIATTRPELLAACVGVACHPDDERYKHLIGKTAVTPLFSAPVRIFGSTHVVPDKGTGILMVCTFGDQTDVQWWREEKLPLRQIVGRDGRLMSIQFGTKEFPSKNPEAANEVYALIEKKNVKQAQKIIVERLALKSAPRPIQHPVKFYEKGDRPVEILTTRQWFVRLLDKKEKLLQFGEKIQWHPEFMKARFRNWTENLGLDWCVSRQRFFGVPIPVWYPIDAAGNQRFEAPIFPTKEQLPVDPSEDAPLGYQESQRGQPGGFVGELDVFDTWFTSSLTPQLVTGWEWNQKRHQEMFPMTLRPQSHEIIRTWAFYTIAKAMLHEEKIPWNHIAVSGWVLDPDRKKMSKSKGNVVTPIQFIEEHGADAVRYWAGSARYGVDTAFDPAVMKVGRRLAMKLFNASKFVLSRGCPAGVPTCALDLALLAKLRVLVKRVRELSDQYETAQALSETEKFFWSQFTDTYLELVKMRAWGEQGTALDHASAGQTLHFALSILVRMFAPFLPYTTETVWDWMKRDSEPSVHLAAFPSQGEFQTFMGVDAGRPELLDVAIVALTTINQQKTESKTSVARPVSRIVIAIHPETLNDLLLVWAEVASATKVRSVEWDKNPSMEPGTLKVTAVEYDAAPIA